MQFRFRKIILGLFLSTLVLPAEVTIISQYQTVNKLGFGNTLIGVALPGMIAALNVLLMRKPSCHPAGRRQRGDRGRRERLGAVPLHRPAERQGRP